LAEKPKPPEPPAGVGDAGTKLWQGVCSDLADGFRFDSRELALLARACTCADHIAALEDVVNRDGPTTAGSRGQVVVHPALAELRAQKIVLLRLLSTLDFGEQGEGSLVTQRARKAAVARWQQRDQREQVARLRRSGGSGG
jgi:phage terminase small subunit